MSFGVSHYHFVSFYVLPPHYLRQKRKTESLIIFNNMNTFWTWLRGVCSNEITRVDQNIFPSKGVD